MTFSSHCTFTPKRTLPAELVMYHVEVRLCLIFYILRTLSRCPQCYDCTRRGKGCVPYVYTSPCKPVTEPNKIYIAFEVPEITFRVM